MGEIQNVGALPAAAATQYATFATHGATGVPSNCGGLDKAGQVAQAAPATQNNNANGVFAPTGGLYGLAYHINVDAAAAFGFRQRLISGRRPLSTLIRKSRAFNHQRAACR